MKLTSPVFAAGGHIPIRYTCDGDNINPPLEFKDVLPMAKSLVLIFEDAGTKPVAWVHWLVFNIPVNAPGIGEAAVPGTAVTGHNALGRPGYVGPCARFYRGAHHVYFHLYALDDMLDIPVASDAAVVRQAMLDHVIENTELLGVVVGKLA